MTYTLNVAKAAAGASLRWPVFLSSLPLYVLFFLLSVSVRYLGASATDIGASFFVFAMMIILVRPIIVGLTMDRSHVHI